MKGRKAPEPAGSLWQRRWYSHRRTKEAIMPDTILEKRAPTTVPIHDIFVRRWSTRAYDPKRPVPREALTVLLEAGRWAMSCNGDEPWRFLIWDKTRDPGGWQKAYDTLSENNRKWVKNAPVIMLACAGNTFEATG